MQNRSAHRRLQFQPLEDRSLLAGDLDLSFGTEGLAIGTRSSFLLDVVELTDGKLLAAGVVDVRDAVVERLLADGSLDTSFGSNGSLSLGFWRGGYHDQLAVQADGKFLVVGVGGGGTGNPNNVHLARYHANGTIDTSFGDDGYIRDGGNLAGLQFISVLIQADGKILAAGHKYASPNFESGFFVARLLSNGDLDSNFGSAGIAQTAFGWEAFDALLQGDGKIVVAGTTDAGDFALFRFTTDGTPDLDFPSVGEQGVVTDFGGLDALKQLLQQVDGKIVAIGKTESPANTPSNLALVRYQENGELDDTFGQNGLVTTDLGADDEALAAALQPDGKIVAVGVQYLLDNLADSADWALVRYHSTGQVDTSFGQQGVVIQNPGDYDFLLAAEVLSNGKLIVAGTRKVADSSVFDGVLGRFLLSDAAGLGFTVTAQRVDETDPNVVLTVARNGLLTGAVSVDYTTASGSASSGEDFAPAAGRLTWNSGEGGAKTITIELTNDLINEEDETFTVQLRNVSGNAILDDDLATITINARTIEPATVRLDAAYFTHDEDGGHLVLNVLREGPDLVEASVNISTLTLDDTYPNRAIAGQDYQSVDTRITWQPGDAAAKTVTIPIVNDAVSEGPEVFGIAITDLEGLATLELPDTAEIVLIDDENRLGSAPDIAKLPGDGLNAVKYAPNGRLTQIIWIGEHLLYRVRQPNGRYTHEVITTDVNDEGSDFRDAEQAQLFYDNSGVPHVLAITGSNALNHYERRDGRWQLVEAVPLPIEYALFQFSFAAALGADNSFHVLLHQTDADGDSGVLTYGTNRTGSWSFETAGTTPEPPRDFFVLANEPRYFSLAVDAQGFVHATYTPAFENFSNPDGTTRPVSQLAYLTNRAGTWTSQVVFQPSDGSGDAGLGASVAIGPDNKPAIAHFYVERVGTGSAQSARLQYFSERPTGGFNVETVATQPDGYSAADGPRYTGFAPHLKFDGSGRPNIAFSDYASQHFSTGADEFGGQIRHAVKVAGQWQLQTVFRQTNPVANQVIYPSFAVSGTELVFAALTRHDEVASDGFILSTERAPILVTNGDPGPVVVLNAIGDRSVDEGRLLTFTATVSGAGTPANALTFSLDPGAPPGASINPTSGVFTWTPTEAQGPGTFDVTVRVTVDGTSNLSDSDSIRIAVREVNRPPVLAAIGDRLVGSGSLLTFDASASDMDAPANTLTFSLDAGAPSGASIDPTSGVFTWMPPQSQEPATFNITVRVTDDGTPNLNDLQTISVQVNDERPWRNLKPHDVNRDGSISPVDALIIINDLNKDGSRLLPLPNSQFAPPPFLDVNGDGFVTPNDVLLIINKLNEPEVVGEGEGMPVTDVSFRSISVPSVADESSRFHVALRIEYSELESVLDEIAEDVTQKLNGPATVLGFVKDRFKTQDRRCS